MSSSNISEDWTRFAKKQIISIGAKRRRIRDSEEEDDEAVAYRDVASSDEEEEGRTSAFEERKTRLRSEERPHTTTRKNKNKNKNKSECAQPAAVREATPATEHAPPPPATLDDNPDGAVTSESAKKTRRLLPQLSTITPMVLSLPKA